MEKNKIINIKFSLMNLIFAVLGGISCMITVFTIIESAKVVKSLKMVVNEGVNNIFSSIPGLSVFMKDIPGSGNMKDISFFDSMDAALGLGGARNVGLTVKLSGLLSMLSNLILIVLLILFIIYIIKLFMNNSKVVNLSVDLNTPVLFLSLVLTWIFVNYINYVNFGLTCFVGILLILTDLVFIAVSLYARKLNRPVAVNDIKALMNKGKNNINNQNKMNNDVYNHEEHNIRREQRPSNYEPDRRNTYSQQVEDEFNSNYRNNDSNHR